MASASESHSTIRKLLFKDAMKGNWEEVVTNYRNYPEAQEARITRSGDTALHVAVSDRQVNIVRKLVETIGDENVSKILNMKNERGNTPLHLAAAIGTEMCKCLVERKPDENLISARNNDQETPLFVAVRHGKRKPFLYLHYKFCSGDDHYSYCRNKEGDTILHCAISRDYFGLAFQIIRLYGQQLANSRNEKGLTPLHILARKPTAFKSGSPLGWFESIIYYCTFVDIQLIQDTSPEISGGEKKPKYPENYGTCVNFFQCLKTLMETLFDCRAFKRKHHPADTENPKQESRGIGGGDASNHPHITEGEPSHAKPGSFRGGKLSNVKEQNGASFTRLIPPNYVTCFDFFKVVMKALLVILGVGFEKIRKIEHKKQKHKWAIQIMEELFKHASEWEYEDDGSDPGKSNPHKDGEMGLSHFDCPPPTPRKEVIDKSKENEKTPTKDEVVSTEHHPIKEETAILVAAMNGVTEIVEKILEKFPVAIQDENSNGKNIVLLAVEHRQPHLYQLLVGKKILKEEIFYKVDSQGNSALHLAATLGEYRPWRIPGAALQMQWEIKWYKFVKDSMASYFFVHHNEKGQTPKQVFSETHQKLVKDGGQWLTNTSQSCSVVAALIATVAFATAATVPGGVQPENGLPTLEDNPAFDVFALSSLIALCFSVTAVIMFLSILTSRYEENDFERDLPKKLIVGLTSLFISIASMLVSFSAGHFIFLKDKLKLATYPVYAVTCLPVTLFAVAQFPLYFDLLRATYKKVPQPSYKVIPI